MKDKYRFTDDNEPNEIQLTALMKEVGAGFVASSANARAIIDAQIRSEVEAVRKRLSVDVKQN
ncbi:MAG: hypothetical protein WCP79_00185 [Bacillota bacterium]